MTIIASDLRVMQSQRMTDNADGGGRMSATQVVDGVMNNVFQDQSDLDRINGRVSLRKIFLQVNSANTDTYLGAFGFLTDPPADPNVSCLLFNTRSATDMRDSAKTYVENYRVRGVKSQFVLYGDHYAGQQTIQVYCRTEIPSPEIGDVLCLSVERAGYTPHEQFVAVQSIALRSTVTFTDSGGDFQRDVLIIRTTTRLVAAFPGLEDPSRVTTSAPTLVRLTQVTDAARFYSARPIAAAVIGALSVTTDSPYMTVVPTATSETPLVDVLAGMGSLAMVQSGVAASLTLSASASAAANVAVTRYLGSPYARRSLNITIGAVALRDDGSGGIVAVDPSNTGWSGSADYTVGAFTLIRDSGFSGTISATATPAGAVQQQSESYSLPITPSTRNLSYVFQLPNFPAPGTALLDYRALGRWVRLTDNGAGQLVGNTNEGSATINYATGTIAATLGALPDNDSEIILAWGLDLRVRNSSGDITVPPPTYRQQLAHPGIDAATLTMAWVSGATPRTATCNAAGAISGNAAGKLAALTAVAEFTTAFPPDPGELITYAYDYTDADDMHQETFTPSAAAGAVSVTLANPAEAGTVYASWNTVPPAGSYPTGPIIRPYLDIPDDGAGGWVTPNAGVNTINYGTGAIVLTVEQLIAQSVPVYTREGEPGVWSNSYISGWETRTVGYSYVGGSPLVIRYAQAGAATLSHSEGHGLPPIAIYMGAGAAGPAVAGSVRFTYRGRTYVDRTGVLVFDVSPTTNAGTVGGSYDYASNTATITDSGSGANTVAINSLLTRYVATGVTGVFFRTPSSPLKEGQFVVRAATMSGVMLTASADVDGDITGTKVTGTVNWQTGVVRLGFGEFVVAAGNEGEDWYDADLIDVDGNIWKPETVESGSIFFGTVTYQSIPVDAELIGLDPVRLPSDGRVPWVRPGDTVIVHHTQLTEIALPVAGATVNLGRPRVAFVEVFDAANAPVASIWYTQNLDAGTLTWADPLNLSAYTLPITIRDRIEDAMLATDVQITGEITLQRALTHNFPDDSVFSSAVTYGDMQARYTNIFDQATYAAGVWSDVLSGAPAAATYNDTIYPIGVVNNSAVDDRWAIVFTAPGTVNVIGEERGQVLTGVAISSDIAPTNPVSGQPYFTMLAAGFGSGWSAGNVIRFNTIAATRPTWIARITKPGPVTVETDQTRFQVYGNAH